MKAAEPRDESALVRRAQRGDPQAFAALVEAHGPRVLAAGHLVTGDADDAADVMQEVMVRAYRNLRLLRDPSRFSQWLNGIFRHVCQDHRRASAQREALLREAQEHLTALEQVPEPLDVEREVMGRMLRQAVRQKALELPETYRTAVACRVLLDMSYQEIAELLEVPIGTAKSLVHRARKMLMRKLSGVIAAWDADALPEAQPGDGHGEARQTG